MDADARHDIASALVEEEWQKVERDPYLRTLRAKERVLVASLNQPGLSRDAAAAIQIQVSKIHARFSRRSA